MECIPRKNEVNFYKAHFEVGMGTPRKQKGIFQKAYGNFMESKERNSSITMTEFQGDTSGSMRSSRWVRRQVGWTLPPWQGQCHRVFAVGVELWLTRSVYRHLHR